MKVYVSMNALPWEQFTVNVPGPDGQPQNVRAESNSVNAGFLPIFWTKEAAEAAFPGHPISEADVADDWHPSLKQAAAQNG
jgi:hypothetical protein